MSKAIPNATTQAAMKEARNMNKNAMLKVNSLGLAQSNLEAASKELRLAQTAFEKAQQRLADAVESHENAQRTLVSEVTSVRNSARVIPLDLR